MDSKSSKNGLTLVEDKGPVVVRQFYPAQLVIRMWLTFRNLLKSAYSQFEVADLLSDVHGSHIHGRAKIYPDGSTIDDPDYVPESKTLSNFLHSFTISLSGSEPERNYKYPRTSNKVLRYIHAFYWAHDPVAAHTWATKNYAREDASNIFIKSLDDTFEIENPCAFASKPFKLYRPERQGITHACAKIIKEKDQDKLDSYLKEVGWIFEGVVNFRKTEHPYICRYFYFTPYQYKALMWNLTGAPGMFDAQRLPEIGHALAFRSKNFFTGGVPGEDGANPPYIDDESYFISMQHKNKLSNVFSYSSMHLRDPNRFKLCVEAKDLDSLILTIIGKNTHSKVYLEAFTPVSLRGLQLERFQTICETVR